MYELASEMYPDYPDPMPVFQYLGSNGKSLLESALSQPAQTFDGRFLYRTIFDKAAILLCSMIKNHPFVDGNKRMGLATMIVFLALNRHVLIATREEAVEQCLLVARTKGNFDYRKVAKWIRSKSITLDKMITMSDEELKAHEVPLLRTLQSLLQEVTRITQRLSNRSVTIP